MMPAVTREMILVIQALVILFTGAMEGLFRGPLEMIFGMIEMNSSSENADKDDASASSQG
jgi:simple sugar transport system permease protein